NRTISKVDDFLADEAKGTNVIGAHSLAEMAALLKRPRRVMLMVKAGKPVDEFIEQLLGVLEPGDIIIDGGNSLFEDTIRRTKYVESKGLLYVGTGVSGGEEGARHGPSIMPGGSKAAWEHVKPIFQAIAAKVDDGVPCCDWVGDDGAGHYVKMTHNGIEYGDMQLICEAYSLFKAAGFTTDEMAAIFNEWNEGDLQSYLIQITGKALEQKDPETGQPLVDVILDKAGQKGTGQWTLINAAENAVVISTINAAVEARVLSSQKKQRVVASTQLQGPKADLSAAKKDLVAKVHDALYASKVISYTQGFDLIKTMGEKKQWGLDFGGIASIWRGGCIIRARFLNHITDAYRTDPALVNLMLAPFFKDLLNGAQQNWREVVALAVSNGIPVPAFSASLSYYDSYRSDRLSANLLQAQRDFFGAHTYERTDKPEGQFFHTEWPEVIG
ncbi:MAG: decarboxylating NADP(+)-dependent phosphogluconate dehydrogenase, partial [Rhodoferax sp.]|uniref:decarboxylating NADP(+)-dependent phosphogluconate dehydrogenase n=1 Tax=Rhodoferax sp. TaxID=50421 RepID=UPI003264108C